MKIYAKAALNKEQIEAKIEAGCDGIEVQLLAELVDEKIGKYFNAEEIFDLESFKKYPVKAVHAPLLRSYGFPDINIEALCAPSHTKLLEQIFKIAEFFAKDDIIIIMHTELDNATLKIIGLYDNILKNMDVFLEKYPHTEVAIENVSPLRTSVKKEIFSLKNNFYNDNILLANDLRKELQTDRIGTVLDTCHMELAEKYIKTLKKEINDEKIFIPDMSPEAFFRNNKEICKLVHLADYKNCGYHGDNHGTPFTYASKDKLQKLIELYYKNEYTCPVTLEVFEEDFKKNSNYRLEKEILEKIV